MIFRHSVPLGAQWVWISLISPSRVCTVLLLTWIASDEESPAHDTSTSGVFRFFGEKLRYLTAAGGMTGFCHGLVPCSANHLGRRAKERIGSVNTTARNHSQATIHRQDPGAACSIKCASGSLQRSILSLAELAYTQQGVVRGTGTEVQNHRPPDSIDAIVIFSVRLDNPITESSNQSVARAAGDTLEA
ncbi:hypothetical protein C8Q74DRAFT_732515 [Fomes fomentarius]|nr:hypothetical protein C8Q74DRAFT_732515 [Fomes fomentarius]